MFNKLFVFTVLALSATSGFLSAEIEYKINDIDTLQTHSSQAIELNNQGQILGWYNIDGSPTGKRFFVRNRNGEFHELPQKTPDAGLAINWQYLKEGGKAYGTFAVNRTTTALCVWDQINGFVNLGVMPGMDVVAINNAGQVLIKAVNEIENGKLVTCPVIWHNNIITKLNGLEGNVGIISDESYGFSMNNKGEVVGKSQVHLVYKDKVYKQNHATKWVNGKAIDLHNNIPKSDISSALSINDRGDILVERNGSSSFDKRYVLNSDGSCRAVNSVVEKINNLGCGYYSYVVYDKEGIILYWQGVNQRLSQDHGSIWNKIEKIISVNDNGEIIANAKTIYGEDHAVLLIPNKQ